MVSSPLVSCIMPTANRSRFVPRAIDYFLAQDYADKELIILDDGEQSVAELIPPDPQLRYLRQARRQSIGSKRNLACQEARGEIIVHWDDDDWSAPWRLSYQVRELLDSGSDICGLDRIWFLDPAARQAWQYIYGREQQAWVHGATLCYRKSFWRRNPFADVNVGEDSRFVWSARGARIRILPQHDFFVGRVHQGNTSPKLTRDSRWHPQPVATVSTLMGEQWEGFSTEPAIDGAADRPAALVSAALGVGDILRVTPLIRVLHAQGFRVDVLVAPDFPETIELLRGAPEIGRLLHYPEFRVNRGTQPLPSLNEQDYAVATFTTWSAPLMRWVKARASHAFRRAEWLSAGDAACVERMARELGWQGPLPDPFAMTSGRDFDLAPGTVALHPGCKPDWPWKKWHGFAGLAGLLPRVVIVGSASDLDNSGTYFPGAQQWPAEARNFVGRLGLADTASLIGQCCALVANDSGLMHLGVALGVPTFGIFGITSPQREMMPSPIMVPLTKSLACEPACRRKPWGQRDCERHLECLRTLTPEEVRGKIEAQLAAPARSLPIARRKDAVDGIRLNYYGYLFDATGYGQAARAYIHALLAADVGVSVIDIGARPAQVADPLIAALPGYNPDADFNLFHGIPPQWASLAYPLRNVIAMTVWETDTMPQRWRNPLSHALDVWLPCQFNVEAFSRDLGRPVFRLPHAIPLGGLGATQAPVTAAQIPGLRDDDYVFYAIFEWQERKNPNGTIEAFLQAFRQDDGPLLVLKTNPGAASVAQRTLEQLRVATGSQGRVALCCAAWSDVQLQALHQRGDCYLSLHKGEGWAYPLFEAACRGKPVIATAYSGPVDYLDAACHWLVRHRPAAVRQAYVYYHPAMNWAEPDLAHASEGLRWIHEHRQMAWQRAQGASAALLERYDLAEVGAQARARLMSLLQRSNPAKWAACQRRDRAGLASPTLPIPGAWYDADYFEHGVKSNWGHGYTWPLFKGVFEDTARYLQEMFPEARSFLDIGCAKGFLVKALRDRGMEAWGFDHSPWAIEHAEAAARDYLELCDVDHARYTRTFDVLMLFSLLEALCEAQIDGLLQRAHGWAAQALIAFIPSPPESGQAASVAENFDLSQVTVRPRSWWHQRFLDAGWRQDALHRIVEQRCRSHPLPMRMGWEIYVYAP